MQTSLAHRFDRIRAASEEYCAPLTVEDYSLQAAVETSPPKWHLAHTSWFFETFILKPYRKGYRPWHPHYEVLFNSYYNGIGAQHPRGQRHLLSRPSVGEVFQYRAYVNTEIHRLLKTADHPDYQQICQRVELGLHHEQQHQELFFTDLKYCFFQNPLFPAYRPRSAESGNQSTVPLQWVEYDGDIHTIGYQGEDFCFDNEQPAHQVILTPYKLANRLITNGEYLEFMDDGGYRQPELWLSDGWTECQQQGWQAPLYWLQQNGEWYEYTLEGLQPLDPSRPVCHVSGYEADAFARWAGARLPTEFELEQALNRASLRGQFVESGEYHPRPPQEGDDQLYGTVWEWTQSAYAPYPNYQPAPGAIGEYNGKFMCNQLVLKGGSCVTSREHIRPTYRNFFYPPDRWQFTGIRLAISNH